LGFTFVVGDVKSGLALGLFN